MKISSDLLQVLQQQPQAQMAVLVHIDGNSGQHVAAVEQLGLSVVHSFSLTNIIAARGAACDVLVLLDRSWVTKVEADQTITTMR